MTVCEALEAIVAECPNEYAKTYAQAGLELGGAVNHVIRSDDRTGTIEVSHQPTGELMVGEEMQVQLLYVLSNLSHWRGDKAKEVRTFLKEAIKK